MADSSGQDDKTRQDQNKDGEHSDTDSQDPIPEEENDLFMRAVEIAVIVEKAQRQSELVKEKVSYIEELARRAKEESNSLQDVATSLAYTATAVATVALQVCSFESYNAAFASKIGYSKKIDLDTFINVVEKGADVFPSTQNREDSSHRLPHNEHDRFGACCDHYSHSRSCYGRERDLGVPCRNTFCSSRVPKPPHVRRHSMEDSMLVRNGHIHQTDNKYENTNKLALSRPRIKSPILRNNTGPSSWSSGSSNSGSGSKKKSSGSGYSKIGELSQDALTSSSEKFSEKFPKPLMPEEYKDHLLVGPFDGSNTSMTPLWEDRYLPGNDSRGNIADKSSWSEKKSMKQFQMRIQQVSPGHVDEEEGDLQRPVTPTPSRSVGSSQKQDDDVMSGRHYGSTPHVSLEDSNHYISHYDVDYDAEVANLLGPKEVNRLRICDPESRAMTTAALLLPSNSDHMQRPISPLLNRDEKDKYGVFMDKKAISPTPERHFFKPKRDQSGESQ